MSNLYFLHDFYRIIDKEKIVILGNLLYNYYVIILYNIMYYNICKTSHI